MEKKKFDFEAFSKKAADDLRSGKPMVGQDGVFTPLLKMLIEGALNGEMDAHLSETRTTKKIDAMAIPRKPFKALWGALRFSLPAIATARLSHRSWRSASIV